MLCRAKLKQQLRTSWVAFELAAFSLHTACADHPTKLKAADNNLSFYNHFSRGALRLSQSNELLSSSHSRGIDPRYKIWRTVHEIYLKTEILSGSPNLIHPCLELLLQGYIPSKSERVGRHIIELFEKRIKI